MIRLISHNEVPQGEFHISIVVRENEFSPTHSPCGGQPGCYKFGPSPLLDQVAKELLAFLRANKIAGADYGQLVQMIDSYTCQRLGNGPRWCYDSEKRVLDNSPTVLASQGGGCCGARP